MLQQEGHPVLHVARVDDMVVVEHQHDIVRDGIEVVKQSDKARLARRLGRLQERERTCTHPAPRLRRSLSLGRATRPRRHLGTWSLVSSNGPAMTTAPQEPVFTCRQ